MKGYCGLGLFSELDGLIKTHTLDAKPILKKILETTILEMSTTCNFFDLPTVVYCLSKDVPRGKAMKICQGAPWEKPFGQIRGDQVMKLLESTDPHKVPPSCDPPIVLDCTNRDAAFEIVLNLYKLGFVEALVRMLEVYKLPVDVYNWNNDFSLPLDMIDFEGDNGRVDLEGLRFCVAHGARLDHLNYVSSFVFRNPEIPLEDYKEALNILVGGGISLRSVFSTAVHRGPEYVDYLVQTYGDKIDPAWFQNIGLLGRSAPLQTLRFLLADPRFSPHITKETKRELLKDAILVDSFLTPHHYDFISFLAVDQGVRLNIPILQARIDHFLANYSHDSSLYMPKLFKK